MRSRWYGLIGSAGVCCLSSLKLARMQFMWGFSFHYPAARWIFLLQRPSARRLRAEEIIVPSIGNERRGTVASTATSQGSDLVASLFFGESCACSGSPR